LSKPTRIHLRFHKDPTASDGEFWTKETVKWGMEVSTDAISDGRVKELHVADAVEERRTNCLRPRRGDVGGSVLGKSGTAGIALPPSEQGQTLVTFRLCHSELGLGNR
jgi:hypothetical protein